MRNYVIMDQEEAKKLTGWENDMDQTYHGIIPGLCCGYNFEVTKDGKTDFCSCTFEYSTPDEVMTNTWYPDYLYDMGLIPTGRVIFRGYFEEYYDPDDRETYYKLVDMNEAFNKYLIKE